MKKLQFLAVVLVVGVSSLFGGVYKVDPSHTNVTFV